MVHEQECAEGPQSQCQARPMDLAVPCPRCAGSGRQATGEHEYTCRGCFWLGLARARSKTVSVLSRTPPTGHSR